MKRPTITEMTLDLAAERQVLDNQLSRLPAEAWDWPSSFDGWSLRDRTVNLVETDEIATVSVLTPDRPPAPRRPSGGLSATMRSWRARRPEALLDWWRDAAHRMMAVILMQEGDEEVPWAGETMSVLSLAAVRLTEYWSYGLDLHDATGTPAVDTNRLRHVANLAYISRPFVYYRRGKELPTTPLYVELTSPGGDIWSWGPEGSPDGIYGSASDWCRFAMHRVERSQTGLRAEGESAIEYLDLIQSFNGPAGANRPSRRRAHDDSW